MKPDIDNTMDVDDAAPAALRDDDDDDDVATTLRQNISRKCAEVVSGFPLISFAQTSESELRRV